MKMCSYNASTEEERNHDSSSAQNLQPVYQRTDEKRIKASPASEPRYHSEPPRGLSLSSVVWQGSSQLRKAFHEELHVCNVELTRKDLILKGSISAAIGCVLGIITSLIVNCTLVEVSLSSFFATYFGCLFLSVGGVIFWRISGQVPEEAEPRKKQLMFFASLIFLSGILCFLLERNWFVGLNRIAKIPIYVLLGISVAFALTFSLVDLINYGMGLMQHTLAKPLVESKNQVYLVLCVSLVKGALFGFIFGVMDVEDEVSYHIRLALLREEHLCYPIGAVLGGLAGFGNEYLRQKDEARNRKRMGDFDEEI